MAKACIDEKEIIGYYPSQDGSFYLPEVSSDEYTNNLRQAAEPLVNPDSTQPLIAMLLIDIDGCLWDVIDKKAFKEGILAFDKSHLLYRFFQKIVQQYGRTFIFSGTNRITHELDWENIKKGVSHYKLNKDEPPSYALVSSVQLLYLLELSLQEDFPKKSIKLIPFTIEDMVWGQCGQNFINMVNVIAGEQDSIEKKEALNDMPFLPEYTKAHIEISATNTLYLYLSQHKVPFTQIHAYFFDDTMLSLHGSSGQIVKGFFNTQSQAWVTKKLPQGMSIRYVHWHYPTNPADPADHLITPKKPILCGYTEGALDKNLVCDITQFQSFSEPEADTLIELTQEKLKLFFKEIPIGSASEKKFFDFDAWHIACAKLLRSTYTLRENPNEKKFYSSISRSKDFPPLCVLQYSPSVQACLFLRNNELVLSDNHPEWGPILLLRQPDKMHGIDSYSLCFLNRLKKISIDVEKINAELNKGIRNSKTKEIIIVGETQKFQVRGDFFYWQFANINPLSSVHVLTQFSPEGISSIFAITAEALGISRSLHILPNGFFSPEKFALAFKIQPGKPLEFKEIYQSKDPAKHGVSILKRHKKTFYPKIISASHTLEVLFDYEGSQLTSFLASDLEYYHFYLLQWHEAFKMRKEHYRGYSSFSVGNNKHIVFYATGSSCFQKFTAGSTNFHIQRLQIKDGYTKICEKLMLTADSSSPHQLYPVFYKKISSEKPFFYRVVREKKSEQSLEITSIYLESPYPLEVIDINIVEDIFSLKIFHVEKKKVGELRILHKQMLRSHLEETLNQHYFPYAPVPTKRRLSFSGTPSVTTSWQKELLGNFFLKDSILKPNFTIPKFKADLERYHAPKSEGKFKVYLLQKEEFASIENNISVVELDIEFEKINADFFIKKPEEEFDEFFEKESDKIFTTIESQLPLENISQRFNIFKKEYLENIAYYKIFSHGWEIKENLELHPILTLDSRLSTLLSLGLHQGGPQDFGRDYMLPIINLILGKKNLTFLSKSPAEVCTRLYIEFISSAEITLLYAQPFYLVLTNIERKESPLFYSFLKLRLKVTSQGVQISILYEDMLTKTLAWLKSLSKGTTLNPDMQFSYLDIERAFSDNSLIIRSLRQPPLKSGIFLDQSLDNKDFINIPHDIIMHKFTQSLAELQHSSPTPPMQPEISPPRTPSPANSLPKSQPITLERAPSPTPSNSSSSNGSPNSVISRAESMQSFHSLNPLFSGSSQSLIDIGNSSHENYHLPVTLNSLKKHLINLFFHPTALEQNKLNYATETLECLVKSSFSQFDNACTVLLSGLLGLSSKHTIRKLVKKTPVQYNFLLVIESKEFPSKTIKSPLELIFEVTYIAPNSFVSIKLDNNKTIKNILNFINNDIGELRPNFHERSKEQDTHNPLTWNSENPDDPIALLPTTAFVL